MNVHRSRRENFKISSGRGSSRTHIFKGKEYIGVLTISHLMSHTSGLPCSLNDKQANGKIALKELEAGIDQEITPHRLPRS